MKKLLLLTLYFICSACFSFSQSVGIGTTSPHGSAQVEISSNEKGLLIPRMTTILINSISNPAKGLMVYDSTSNRLMVNMGSPTLPNWQTIVSNSGWSLSGNSGTIPAAQFIGTTDDNPLMFRINYKFAGKIDSADGQTFFGFGAGRNTTGFGSTAFGYQSLPNATSLGNTAFGYQSLLANTTGYENIAIGIFSLFNNNTGNRNIAIGRESMGFNTSGQHNISIGYWSLIHNTFGCCNIAIGSWAGNESTTAFYNTSVGYQAGTLYNMGYNNTMIGANSDMSANGLFNTIAVGQAVTVTASSQARIGNSATNSIGGYTNWTNISDGRFKKDIQDGVKGIDFIMKLRPVTYRLDVEGISKTLNEGRGNEVDIYTKQAISEKERIVFSGFIAQDVEKAAQESSYEFSGIDKPKNEKDFYGLRYAEFVVPLVKAMQEQQSMITEMKTLITDLQKRIILLEEQNKMLMQLLNKKN